MLASIISSVIVHDGVSLLTQVLKDLSVIPIVYGNGGGSRTRFCNATIGGKIDIRTGHNPDPAGSSASQCSFVDGFGIGDSTIGGQTKIKIGAADGLVLVENSTFDRNFKADGCRGTDTFIDGGGNTFSSGSPKLKKFEIVLP